MARETLGEFLRENYDPAPDKISYKIDDQGRGFIERGDDLGIDPNTGAQLLDLENENVGLLGDYLAFIVKNIGRNTYKIATGNEQAASSNRGDSLAIAEEQGAESVFVESGTSHSLNLEASSNSGYLENDGITLGDIINKTGYEGTSDDLLKGVHGRPMNTSGVTKVNTPDVDSKAVDASLGMLKRYNRFTGGLTGKPFANVTTPSSGFDKGEDSAGTMTSQREFGDYNPDTVKYAMDNIKSIGASLLYKMAGWDRSDTPGDSADLQYDDNELSTFEKEIVDKNVINSKYDDTSDNLQVPFTLARAMNADGAPELISGDDAQGMSIGGLSSRIGRGSFLSQDEGGASTKTYGTLTTPVTRAGAVNVSVLRAQAAAAVVAIQITASSMIEMLHAISGFKPTDNSNILATNNIDLGRGPFVKGQHKIPLNAKTDLISKLALVQTDYTYADALSAGLKVFFGDESKDAEKVANHPHIKQAPEFWLSIASSVLKSAKSTADVILESVSDDPDNLRVYEMLSRSRFVKFLNVAATVGDIMLKATGGRNSLDDITLAEGARNVDYLPDGPATRHMKSRASDGPHATSLAWRCSSMPSMYMIPRNIVNATIDMNTLTVGTNPVKGMVGSNLYKSTYIDRTIEGTGARIPKDIAERMENRLDAEYVPFYIQDLRTNEIVAFHAFLSNLTDNIAAQWSESTGYGRMDSVQIYGSTKRTINVGFTLMATSREDFDEMWFKINKLTTLLYPQWTQGTKVVGKEDSKNVFIQPFSQVIGASPLVRLRVGDVIKSNYSKFNLARIFGVGDAGITPKTSGGTTAPVTFGKGILDVSKKLGAEIFYGLYGSPLQYIPTDKTGAAGTAMRISRSVVGQFLDNGFVNPLGAMFILNCLRNPDTEGENSIFGASLGKGYGKMNIHYLKPNPNGRYIIQGSGKLGESNFLDLGTSASGEGYIIRRPVKIMITESPLVDPKQPIELGSKTAKSQSPFPSTDSFRARMGPNSAQKTHYKVIVIDLAAGPLFNKEIIVTHDDIIPNYSFLFNRYVMPAFASLGAIADIAQAVVNEAAAQVGIPANEIDIFGTDASNFMLPENNPVVRSFNTTRGRGLAGVIDGINFNWLDFPWETDWGARAPQGVKISFSFRVIHDIPPGLDHTGFNRAPLYNVGGIMNTAAGDPFDDNGLASEVAFSQAGKAANSTDKRGG